MGAAAAHLETGRIGEDAAAAHLEAAGLVVVDRNWRSRQEGSRGELDLVARDGAVLVVCEVKTRRTDRYGMPASAVGRVKTARLRRLAVAWLAEHRESHPWTRGADVRFDVVSIVLNSRGECSLDHLRGVL